MAFVTPKYTADFILPFITALDTIIGEDADAALLWANGGTALPAFAAAHHAAPQTNIKFPLRIIRPERTQMKEDDAFIQELHTVIVEVAIIGPDPDLLARELTVYVRAVDAIIRTASAARLLADFTSASTKRGGLEWEITTHDYDIPVPNAPASYLIVGQLTVLLAIKETR